MSRSKRFQPSREPFKDRDDLSLVHSRISGPISFLNPTRAHYHVHGHEHATWDAKYYWRSRDNRKGRHALRISGQEKDGAPQRTDSPAAVLKGILRMFTCFPVWDISYLVALIFTLGSIVWVINGFFAFLPLVAPSTEFAHESTTAAGVTAFIGAILFFETGSVLLIIEAINENNTGCFGYALEKFYTESGTLLITPKGESCVHHHQNKGNFVGEGSRTTPSVVRYKQDLYGGDKSWQWFPSWASIKTNYIHEIGFLASYFQLMGATIFGISGFTALPGILNHLEKHQGLLDGIYWVPQVIGGSGFIISGTLYMLETQETWWKPAFKVLGWHIGFWNLIGAIGFTLCGALGMAYDNSGAQYEAALATFWGSWAFLIGSVIQLYESLSKYPVESY